MANIYPSILALATAVPPCFFQQDEAAEKLIHILELDAVQGERLRKLYRHTAIDKRHTIIDDFKKPRSNWNFWGSCYPATQPGMANRNQVYKTEAPHLAHEAAAKALQEWGGDPQSITHVISISCTGVIAPGIEFHLVKSLGLNPQVNRLGINFMGCFGAFKGLSVASSFAKESPDHRILVVCTELCSLHMQTDQTGDTLISNSLFSDGAAAAIIGLRPQKGEKALWDLVKHRSVGLENSLEHMSWEAGDHGFLMRLSPFVPQLIGDHIQPFAQALMDTHVIPQDCDWAIHPGGKAILHTIEKKMALEKNQTIASWEILNNYGNMSSATFLFVLESLHRKQTLYSWTVGLGFGPGLSIEGILLKKALSL